ncbi:transmembrane protein 145-like isoform X2 [Babylonia areolata]|uniref:transmembrane protein 145-like isoform X2 n=1 Tax=Babylonia areolata TaxID=304850 RepID=UPI003FD26D1D
MFRRCHDSSSNVAIECAKTGAASTVKMAAARNFKTWAVVCFCFTLAELSSAKWLKSSVSTSADWSFLTRFCFLSEDGRFDFTFVYPQDYGTQQLLLYYDAPGQWESVYKSEKNCSARVSVLSKALNQIIDLTDVYTGSRSAGCQLFTQDGQPYYNCTDSVSFRASRERWWYIAVARCDPSKTGLQLDYTMHMMNGAPDDILHYELSADEFYILPVDITFLLVYVLLLVVSIICAVVLYNRQMLHTTYRMYVASLSLWLFGLLLLCIAWGRYSSSGWEEDPTEVTGRLFQAGSTVVFLLMLILMAKGYTITRGRLTQMSAIRLAVFFCVYVVVNIVLFVWEGVVFDEGFVLYFYESTPGYGLITMRLIGWLWFLYAVFFTMKHHQDKASFYIPFFIFYTIWFWAGPVVIVVAIFSMPKWSREKTVNGVEQFVGLCGHLFFLVLTRPSAANTNFPYHLRVSQVRFTDDTEDPADNYAMSEESRRHLDNLFVVQQNGSQLPSSATARGRHTAESGGHINGGYVGEQGGQNGGV